MPMECHASKFSNYIGLGLMYSFLYQISEISKSAAPFTSAINPCVFISFIVARVPAVAVTCLKCIFKKINENYKTLCTHDYSNVGYVTSRGGGGIFHKELNFEGVSPPTCLNSLSRIM